MLRSVRKAPDECHGCFHDYLTDTVYTARKGQIIEMNPKAGDTVHELRGLSANNDYKKTDVKQVFGNQHRLILIEGQAIMNTDGRLISSSSESTCKSRGIMQIKERSCWQIYSPVSLIGIQIGVCSIQSNGKINEIIFSFNSSTSRTVTFLADNGVIKVWVNESVPAKNSFKQVNYTGSAYYPYLKLKGEGKTAVYNPYASEPNSAISILNPFNTLVNDEDSQIIKSTLKITSSSKQNGIFCSKIVQLDKDRMLVIAGQKRIRLIVRDEQTKKIKLPKFFIEGDNIFNVLNFDEWNTISQLCKTHSIKLPAVPSKDKWTQGCGFSIQQISSLAKYLCIALDSICSSHKYQTNFQKASDIVYHKLLPILAQNLCLPNPIHPQYNPTTQVFFPQLTGKIKYSKSLKANIQKWTQLSKQDEIIGISQHYICVYSRSTSETNDKSDYIIIFHIGDYSISEVFRQQIKINELNKIELIYEGKQESYKKLIQGHSFIATQYQGLWKETNQGPSIYKILQSCFNDNLSGISGDFAKSSQIYEVKEKDLRQLVEDYKIQKKDAIIALEECGNIEEGLAWLSNPKRKTTKKREKKQGQESQHISLAEMTQQISMIELDNPIARLLLQIGDKIYLIGADCLTAFHRYLRKSEKGFINLASLSYCLSLAEIQYLNSWYNDSNHCKLSILDVSQLKKNQAKSNCLGLFVSNQVVDSTFIIIEENQMLMKMKIIVNPSKIYSEFNCFDVSDSSEPLSEQDFISKDKLRRLVTGQWFVLPQGEGSFKQQACKDKISFIENGQLYSSIPQVVNIETRTSSVSLYLQKIKNEGQMQEQSNTQSGQSYLPLLVEHGPPGCNLNYPICSILYPKSALPFLANYPYSLSFKHLHKKFINVSEIIISRLNSQKKNVNQIKEGYVYFTNSSDILASPYSNDAGEIPKVSKKYKFQFGPQQKEYCMKIDQPNYWQYMIIEPLYTKFKKLPFEIGFVGAKGTSIDIQIYEAKEKQNIEKGLTILLGQQKCRYEIKKYEQISYGLAKVGIQIINKKASQSNNFKFKTNEFSIVKYQFNADVQQIFVEKQKKQLLKSYEICQLPADEMLKVMTKPPYSKNCHPKIINEIFREILKSQQINFGSFSEGNIRKFIDIWQMNPEIQLKTYERLLQKILSQSKPAKAYLEEFWRDLGKGYTTFDPRYLKLNINKACELLNSDTIEQILADLISSIDKLSSPHYKNLKKYGTPYLLLQNEYYSSFYYKQMQEYQQNSSQNINYLQKEESNLTQFNIVDRGASSQIYEEQLLIKDIEAVVLKQEYIRKMYIKINQDSGYSIRNLILRFDKSDLYTKAIVNIYAHVAEKNKQLLCRQIIQEHQWIQITKNPYRQQMTEMFKNNNLGLNAYAFNFSQRIQARYFEVQIMFTLSGLTGEKREKDNLPSIDIIPELFGKKTDSMIPKIEDIDTQYFSLNKQEKFYISKLPLHLNISSNQVNKSKNSEIFFNKYLVNKHNIQFNHYQMSSSEKEDQSQSQVPLAQQIIDYKEKINTFIGQETNEEALHHKKISQLVKTYQKLMDQLKASSDSDGSMRYSRKLGLDYCYTALIVLLKTLHQKKMKLSQKISQQLLDSILANQTGPLAITTFLSIAHHPTILAKSLQYVQILSQTNSAEKLTNNKTTTKIAAQTIKVVEFPKNYSKNVLNSISVNDKKIKQSLLNFITVCQQVNKESIGNCIQLLNNEKNQFAMSIKIIEYILQLKENQQTMIFWQTQKQMNEMIVNFVLKIVQQNIHAQKIVQKFTEKLSEKEIEKLLLLCHKEVQSGSIKETQSVRLFLTQLLSQLMSKEKRKDQQAELSIQVISIILELKLDYCSKWQYLSNCLSLYRNEAQDNKSREHQFVIFSEYLSVDGIDNRQELIEILLFHRDILHQASKSSRHSEMLVNFLQNLLEQDNQLFKDTILNLSPSVSSLHPEFCAIIIQILDRFCNVGGIEGAKLLDKDENIWLIIASKLLAIIDHKHPNFSSIIRESQIEGLIKWYLNNNSYEHSPTNPVNRSPAVNHITNIANKILSILTLSNKQPLLSRISISKILTIYNQEKNLVKNDHSKLLSCKYITLSRLKAGVSKLLQNSVKPEQLTDLFIGNNQSQFLSTMVKQLLEEEENRSKKIQKINTEEKQEWENMREIQLSEEMQGFTTQGPNTKQINLNVKDWQSYKNGSKSFACKVSASSKKLVLCPKNPVSLNKFVVGVLVQQNADKNFILPDCVELFGTSQDKNKGFHKICNLIPIEDQNYYQFGVKLFGMNFNTANRKYKNNSSLSKLQLRFRSHVLPSCSDVLENYQKVSKNASFHISFISVLGYDKQPASEPSYSQIYMKLLSFLSYQNFSPTIKSLTQTYFKKNPKILSDLIKILSIKSLQKIQPTSGLPQSVVEQILINLAKNGVSVLEQLLKLPETNSKLVKTILNNKLDVQSIDLVLTNTLKHNFCEQAVDSLVQNIKICSYELRNNSQKHSKSTFSSQIRIQKIVEEYQRASRNNSNNKVSNRQLYQKLLACIFSTHNIFDAPLKKITEKLLQKKLYKLVASYIHSSREILDWILQSGRVETICQNLLKNMTEFKVNKQIQSIVQKYICLVSSFSIDPVIRQRIVHNEKNLKLNKLPIKVFGLLENDEKLLEEYSKETLQHFINFFKQTCAKPSAAKFATDQADKATNCSEDFAAKLIDLMVKLPSVSSQYHHVFIHDFFFPLINTYEGVSINFIWKQSGKFLSKPTAILSQLPIRANDEILQHNKSYFKLQNFKWQKILEKRSILTVKGSVKAIKQANSLEWKSVDNKEISYVTKKQNQWNLKVQSKDGEQIVKVFNNADNKQEKHQIYVQDSRLISKLSKLLTNQTLLRVSRPQLFGKNYLSTIPAKIGMFDHLYYIPLEITPRQLLKEVNLCGYRLNDEIIQSINLNLVDQGISSNLEKDVKISESLSRKQSLKHSAVLQIEIDAHKLFSLATIEKISKSSLITSSQNENQLKFIPQETVFKVFESLSGLEKMIKVMMSCVKNWSSVQQSKIWHQYLNQLESFSCFPVFSSIYMTKQENVNLLFSILSGLPDKEDSKKWLESQKKNVKNLYEIIKNVFEVQGEQAKKIREYAVKNKFYQTMLERLHLIAKEPKRQRSQMQQVEQILQVPTMAKKNSEQEYKKQIKKKKGVGYGTDASSNTKWDLTGHQEAKKELSDQILGLFKILEKFLSYPNFKLPSQILESTYNSALLPILQSSLRGGSLLEISKNADLFKGELQFIRALGKKQQLIPCLMDIPKEFEPKQSESIYTLLKTLEGTSKIFLSCLTGSVSQKLSEQIAKNIIEIFNQIDESITNYKSGNIDEEQERKILELPLAKKYPILLKDLRFDYIDMKDKFSKMKHHYSSSYQPNHTSPAAKTIRLAQELADISHALPIDHTNAIYVRCDKERVDFMQALIMGSNGTPYAHGAYLFDIYFEDSYPNNPPKVNLTTTGSGSVRFNPNLYQCGKVCLSLLGTWRGSAMENWDSKVSTLLQVLVSIQSIIMAQDVYFNEPGFEHQQGTVEGQKKNEAYSNIVRYSNVKFAMLENIKNPPKGFESIIKRHFYLKKDEILEECRKWLKYAEKREASYTGLVSDHNSNWCNTFKKSKDEYRKMLEKVIQELEIQMNKLPQPSAKDLKKAEKSQTKTKKEKKKIEEEVIEEIDVTYEVKPVSQEANYRQLDINDEKVKDRWSRYIGAMGLDAVNKQSKANILQFGLSALGIQIAKNIVMSGCKKFTVCDSQITSFKDLSGQFYLTEDDIGKKRVEACLYKLQELNNYVRVDSAQIDVEKIGEDESILALLKNYDVIISTTHTTTVLIKIDAICRKLGIKFISAKCEGPYGYVFNDFGQNFQVADKNGEETVQCMIQSISNDEQGIVKLPEGQRHPYEDDQAVRITKVKGMLNKKFQGQSESQPQSINGTVHRIKVINPNSFKIGNTLKYGQYQGNGLVRNMKLPRIINFKNMEICLKEINIDSNLQFYDFAKGMNSRILHDCFNALSTFIEKNGEYPKPWNWQDSETILGYYKALKGIEQDGDKKLEDNQIKYIRKFSFTCSGSFAPLCAFYGGLIAQQAFKAITAKYMPINQYFFTDFSEVVKTLPQDVKQWQESVSKYKPNKDRFEALRVVVGDELLTKIRECKVFLIGAGAIGCQLLKNYAMINLATSQQAQKGEIIVTDPDHIETSNLNRQFLFRQKHIQKPKSATAAAVIKQMNKFLRQNNKIKVKLLKVCEATKETFSNQFFQNCTIVTNALDNVQARQYVDMRCVQNKVPLLESGTLSSKGHVQVIIPYKTETYGSKADPAQDGEIPHCTLKMFPEQTLHCVQWARDIFGKMFTMKPKALQKMLENLKQYEPNSSEKQIIRDCLNMLDTKPNSFDDAISIAVNEFYKLYRNDIKQLLYTYPLDAKGKDGKDFWKLPKRPPMPIESLNPDQPLHCQFITSYAVMLCKIYNIPFPKDFRNEARQKQIALQALQIKVQPFVPSDKLAKEMASEVESNQKEDKQETIVEKDDNMMEDEASDILTKLKVLVDQEKQLGNQLTISVEQFQKDEDSNGHIDLIYSMANLRASNYKLDPMDWITTKLKAGRITPALSTTTSCIAGLQTIQLIKYLACLPLDQMKNTFLNLAVPIIQAGEPGDVESIKIHEQLSTNIWERWSIQGVNLNDCTMEKLIDMIQQKYKVTVKTLTVVAGGNLFSDLVLGLESKKKEKEKFMTKLFKDTLLEEGTWEESNKCNFVDLNLVMAVKEEFVKHVPTVRINFSQ